MKRTSGSRLGDFLRSRPGAWFLRLAARTPLRRYLLSGTYDPASGFSVGTGDMERDWDKRARENPKYFIAVTSAASDEAFRVSGEQQMESLLSGIALPADARVLEIGCGIGRLLRPMASRAREVHGVDISSEMIRQGTEALADLPNVRLHHTSGDLRMLENDSVDFCYSVLVFPHIAIAEAVRKYIEEAGRVLRSGAWFRFQISISETESVRKRGGGTWFGVVFSEAEVVRMLDTAGFEVVKIEHHVQDNALWSTAQVTARRR